MTAHNYLHLQLQGTQCSLLCMHVVLRQEEIQIIIIKAISIKLPNCIYLCMIPEAEVQVSVSVEMALSGASPWGIDRHLLVCLYRILGVCVYVPTISHYKDVSHIRLRFTSVNSL